MLALIIIVIAFCVLAIGNVLGFMMATYHGGRAAFAYADWLTEKQRSSEGDEHGADDLESRLDALTIRDLLNSIRPVLDNRAAAAQLALGEYTALSDEFKAARDRFAPWIEWAEGATDTKSAIAPDEAAV
jgi:hypothetical protein